MNIIIDNKEAVLKKGSSFEFIEENRFFTGADAYTLSMTFPLRDCPQNLDIFGHINRKDCDLDSLLMDCEIHDKAFHRYGSVSIVEIDETEVKTQFLEGRSARNFHSSLDDIYINELELPSLIVDAHLSADVYLRSYRQQKEGVAHGEEYFGFVCLPWVNNTSGNIQNAMALNQVGTDFFYTGGGPYEDVTLVGQPFLIEVIRQVLSCTGYSFDLSAIEDSQWANAIVCNALPMIWGLNDMQFILPHWSVSEFLEQMELFLNGEFVTDEKSGSMTFRFNSEMLEEMGTIVLENVTDSHQVEITQEEDVQNSYIEQRNLAYTDSSHRMWKFYSCPWFKEQARGHAWNSFAAMKARLDAFLDCAGLMTHNYYKDYHYCIAEDTYFILKCVGAETINGVIHHYMRYQPINMFGPRIIDEREDADSTEISIVPVCIDNTDAEHGDLIFIECGELGNDIIDPEDSETMQTQIVNMIENGEDDKDKAFFDRLFVAFYDGNYRKYIPYLPRPEIDTVEVSPDNTLLESHYSMRLSGDNAESVRTSLYSVDHSQKFTFSFIADSIPDVRSVFLIHGKKYLAEKITATISESGLSQMMKMVAYRLQ